eukprot:TRINITY_DN169_c0_g6_i1.p1 TRINITY_DN169_c0_g6~~TRINITY_DN169_c0_g6_i1.p1  ORF type:complete len:1200 (+),score=321.27 TRINITY_DN169_c0_g6_i1:269-3601(+)
MNDEEQVLRETSDPSHKLQEEKSYPQLSGDSEDLGQIPSARKKVSFVSTDSGDNQIDVLQEQESGVPVKEVPQKETLEKEQLPEEAANPPQSEYSILIQQQVNPELEPKQESEPESEAEVEASQKEPIANMDTTVTTPEASPRLEETEQKMTDQEENKNELHEQLQQVELPGEHKIEITEDVSLKTTLDVPQLQEYSERPIRTETQIQQQFEEVLKEKEESFNSSLNESRVSLTQSHNESQAQDQLNDQPLGSLKEEETQFTSTPTPSHQASIDEEAQNVIPKQDDELTQQPKERSKEEPTISISIPTQQQTQKETYEPELKTLTEKLLPQTEEADQQQGFESVPNSVHAPLHTPPLQEKEQVPLHETSESISESDGTKDEALLEQEQHQQVVEETSQEINSDTHDKQSLKEYQQEPIQAELGFAKQPDQPQFLEQSSVSTTDNFPEDQLQVFVDQHSEKSNTSPSSPCIEEAPLIIASSVETTPAVIASALIEVTPTTSPSKRISVELTPREDSSEESSMGISISKLPLSLIQASETSEMSSPHTPIPLQEQLSALDPGTMFVQVPVLFFAQAEFDFEAENETEVSVKKGDVISVIEARDHDGWYRCQVQERVGFIPANHVRQISSPRYPSTSPIATTSTSITATTATTTTTTTTATTPPKATTATTTTSPLMARANVPFISRQEELTQVSHATSSVRDKWKNLEQQQQQQQAQQHPVGHRGTAIRARVREIVNSGPFLQESASSSCREDANLSTAGRLRAEWENRIKEAAGAAIPSKPARRGPTRGSDAPSSGHAPASIYAPIAPTSKPLPTATVGTKTTTVATSTSSVSSGEVIALRTFAPTITSTRPPETITTKPNNTTTPSTSSVSPRAITAITTSKSSPISTTASEQSSNKVFSSDGPPHIPSNAEPITNAGEESTMPFSSETVESASTPLTTQLFEAPTTTTTTSTTSTDSTRNSASPHNTANPCTTATETISNNNLPSATKKTVGIKPPSVSNRMSVDNLNLINQSLAANQNRMVDNRMSMAIPSRKSDLGEEGDLESLKKAEEDLLLAQQKVSTLRQRRETEAEEAPENTSKKKKKGFFRSLSRRLSTNHSTKDKNKEKEK